MKKFFSILAVAALALGFVACNPNSQLPQDKEYKVELSADKSEILADGEDSATFAVKVDGAAHSEDVMIICLNDNSVLEGTTFATTAAGEYRFKAAYKGFSSETITIKATAVEVPISEVVLSADKSEIVADNADTVTFTVVVDGEDKSSEAKITIVNYNSELEGNSFVTDVAGEFSFVAEYEGVKSNEVKVTATAVEAPVQKTLKIKTDVTRIKADGVEKATFTVLYGDDDVTADAAINCVSHTGITITDSTFSTTTVGSYSFRATYNGQTTGASCTVDAYDPNLTSQYEPGTYYNNNGVEGIIYAVKADRHGDTYVYIMSLDEEDLQWSTEKIWCNCASEYGHWNTEDMLRNGTSPDKYPAAQWCTAHGDGWCMPSSKELNWMWEAITDGERDFKAAKVSEYNALLEQYGGEPFCETYYWSSNETSDDLVEVIAFMNDSVVCLDPQKDNTFTVRASYRFLVE